jgi:ribosomal subunit interface protein
MEIRVSGHQVDTGEALRTHARSRIEAMAVKYASRIVSAQVTFGKGPHDHGFTCEILAYLPQGVVLKAIEKAAEAHAAFDSAAEKVEKQLRRHVRKLKDHHSAPSAEELEMQAELRRGDASAPAA